jgi:prophage antirepressor-like protein
LSGISGNLEGNIGPTRTPLLPHTTNALTTFNFQQNNVRVVEIDDQPWFSASDVCDVLDLATNAAGSLSNILNRLDPSERMVLGRRAMPNVALFTGSASRVALVSESGVYALIFLSRKPEAKQFRLWVT